MDKNYSLSYIKRNVIKITLFIMILCLALEYFFIMEKTSGTIRVVFPSAASSSNMYPSNKIKVNCSTWRKPLRNVSALSSQIILAPDRFLYPGLIWGPNNQIVGLFQSIYVAIRLNRTLVVPRFGTQHTEGEIQSVPDYQRIDVDHLCSFVSCISIEDFHKKCHGSMDVVFQAMLSKMRDVEKFQRDTQMHIIMNEEYKLSDYFVGNSLQSSEKPTNKANIPFYPCCNNKASVNWLSSNQQVIRSTFNTTASCALFASAYQPLMLKSKGQIAIPLDKNYTKVRQIRDDTLYMAIVDSVRRPKCITQLADAYIDANIGTDEFVAVHWRYDKNDWLRVFRGLKRYELCEVITNITSEDVARAIINNLPLLHDKKEIHSHNISAAVSVYIATPPSLKEFKLEIFDHLEKLDRRIKKVPLDLDVYLSKSVFNKCWNSTGWVSLLDILSLTEMEIMRKSKYFFYSHLSTWSDNIRPLRWKRSEGKIQRLFEASILDLSKTVMKNRIKRN
ncbi:uncharacterized protein LOC143459948 [Clavelina lepadiformis]|uniref:uncharacterized protein LOC143459948 n=1 Tax=Clavelina lepadiformis TaxID=159417 RepID=UPI0040410AAA